VRGNHGALCGVRHCGGQSRKATTGRSAAAPERPSQQYSAHVEFVNDLVFVRTDLDLAANRLARRFAIVLRIALYAPIKARMSVPGGGASTGRSVPYAGAAAYETSEGNVLCCPTPASPEADHAAGIRRAVAQIDDTVSDRMAAGQRAR
jgi:hypothetical protein